MEQTTTFRKYCIYEKNPKNVPESPKPKKQCFPSPAPFPPPPISDPQSKSTETAWIMEEWNRKESLNSSSKSCVKLLYDGCLLSHFIYWKYTQVIYLKTPQKYPLQFRKLGARGYLTNHLHSVTSTQVVKTCGRPIS